MATFKEGQRVKLLANKEEGWPAEKGVVLEDYGDGTYVVEVDARYRSEDDDGLRDGVGEEQMRADKKKKKKKKATHKKKKSRTSRKKKSSRRNRRK